MSKRLVLDSNILLLDANNIAALAADGTVIVLPETVLEEVDNKKSVVGELGYQARSVGRYLASCSVKSIGRDEDVTTTTLVNDTVTIEVIALDTYSINADDSGSNDQKIIQCAKYVEATCGNSVFMSNDVMCRLRAMSVGLSVTDLKTVAEKDHEFVREFTVSDPEVFRTLHNASIYSVDTEYCLEQYSYKFTCSTTSQIKLATIANGYISVIGKDSERELRKQECAPVGAEQLLMSKAILDPTIDLVVVEGKAGSGKNIVAVSSLMKVLRTNKDKYNSIVYIRNPVDDVGNADEEIGFLSTNEGKEAVYLGPMEDTLQFIVRNKYQKNNNESIPEYEGRIDKALATIKADYGVESMISLGLRGRTFSNALIILDEFQNAGASTTQKVLTRIGKDCKVVVLGSMNQIDSKYLTKHNNGLAVVMDEAANRRVDSDINMFAIKLQKTQRSAMCDFAEKLFSSDSANLKQ